MDAALQGALASVYDTPERPRCMCVRGGVDMYVAKYRDYVLKRMPDTGSEHHPLCPVYEPHWTQSGLGQLLGEAIIQHSPESIELRLAFPLSRHPGRAPQRTNPDTPAEINAPRHAMSLRALLHYLWERAGFNRWYPAMKDKRSWAVVRKYLMEAAEGLHTKGLLLSERLYVPEPFSEEHAQAIAQRRREALALLHSPEDAVQYKMALLVGEFKADECSPYGQKVWVKHMSDCPLFVDANAWRRIQQVFGWMFQGRDANTPTKPKVVMAALVYAKREHIYQIDTASFMLATASWIPVEAEYEINLVETLIQQSRRFLKPLRYDAKSAPSIPNVLLLDTGDKPTAMHIIRMEARERAAKDRAIKAEQVAPWVWCTDKPMPALPPAARYRVSS